MRLRPAEAIVTTRFFYVNTVALAFAVGLCLWRRFAVHRRFGGQNPITRSEASVKAPTLCPLPNGRESFSARS